MKTKIKLFALLLACVCVLSFNMTNAFASEKKTVTVNDGFNDTAFEGSVDSEKWKLITSDSENPTIEQSVSENPSMEFVAGNSSGEQVQYGTVTKVQDIEEVRFSFRIPTDVDNTWIAVNFVSELTFADAVAGANVYETTMRCFRDGAMNVAPSGISANATAWSEMFTLEDGRIHGKWVSVKIIPVSEVKAEVYFALRNNTIENTVFPTTPNLVLDKFPDGDPADTSYTVEKYNYKNAYILWGCEAPGKGVKLDDLYVRGSLPEGSVASVGEGNSQETPILELTENFTSSELSEDFVAYFCNKPSMTFSQAFKFTDDNKLNFTASKSGDRIVSKNKIVVDDSPVTSIDAIHLTFNVSLRDNDCYTDKIAVFFGLPTIDADPLSNSYSLIISHYELLAVVYKDGQIVAQNSYELANTEAIKGSDITVKVKKDGLVEVYEDDYKFKNLPVAEVVGGFFGFGAIADNQETIQIDNVSVTNSSYFIPLTKSVTHNFSNDFFGNKGSEDFFFTSGSGDAYVEDGKLVYNGAVDDTFFGSAHQYDSFILDYQICNIYVTKEDGSKKATPPTKWHGLDVGRKVLTLTEYGHYAMILFEIHSRDGVEYTYPNIYTKGLETSLQKDNKDLVEQVWHKPIPTSLFKDIHYDGNTVTLSEISAGDAVCVRWVSDSTNSNLKLYLKKASEVDFTLYYEVRGIDTTGYQALSCTGYTFLQYDNFSMANTSPIYDVADNEVPETIIKTETEIIYDPSHADVNWQEELNLNGFGSSNGGATNEKSGCFGTINGGLTALTLLAVCLVVKKKKN